MVLNRLRNKGPPYSVVTSSRSQPCPWDRSESVLGSAQQCLRPTPSNPSSAPLSRDVRASGPPRCRWHRGSGRAPLPSRGRACPAWGLYDWDIPVEDLNVGKIRVATRRDHDRDDAGETRKTSNSDRREHQRDATVLGVEHGRRGGG